MNPCAFTQHSSFIVLLSISLWGGGSAWFRVVFASPGTTMSQRESYIYTYTLVVQSQKQAEFFIVNYVQFYNNPLFLVCMRMCVHVGGGPMVWRKKKKNRGGVGVMWCALMMTQGSTSPEAQSQGYRQTSNKAPRHKNPHPETWVSFLSFLSFLETLQKSQLTRQCFTNFH